MGFVLSFFFPPVFSPCWLAASAVGGLGVWLQDSLALCLYEGLRTTRAEILRWVVV
jgi:hypothetical protein